MKYLIGGMKYSISKIRASVNLAIYLSEKRNRKVLLIDADPFTCAKDYARWRSFKSDNADLCTVELKDRSLKAAVLKYENQFDDIVIDCGVGENLKYSLEIADRFIVPFNTKDKGLWTLWTLANMETLIDHALDLNANLRSYSFLDMSKEGNENSECLIKALKDSQYLEFLSSGSLKDSMVNDDGQLNSLGDMKEILSLVNHEELL